MEAHKKQPNATYTGKRLLDVVVSILALVLLSPVLVLISALVWITMGSPILFHQERAGLHGEPFTLNKFRTMTNAQDAHGNMRPDAERLTSLGRFLRSTSLDELPELFNVVKGTMSVVGPRPLLTRYYPFFTEHEHVRHTVRPGITGWAQLKGRNYLSWEERLSADVWYVENQSLILDIEIMVATIISVLKREGVAVNPSSVMLDFDEERRQQR